MIDFSKGGSLGQLSGLPIFVNEYTPDNEYLIANNNMLLMNESTFQHFIYRTTPTFDEALSIIVKHVIENLMRRADVLFGVYEKR